MKKRRTDCRICETDRNVRRRRQRRSEHPDCHRYRASEKKGDTVGITGFGTFSVAKRAARKGRNPATGEAIKIAASKTPKFTAGATLKAAVNPPKKK